MRTQNMKKLFAGVLAVCLAGSFGKCVDTAVFASEDTTPALVMGNPQSEQSVQLVGLSASLEGNIGLNFFVKIPENLMNSEDASVYFEHGNKTNVIAVEQGKYDEKNDCYKFTCYVSAKEMNDDITIRVYDGFDQQKLVDTKGKSLPNNQYTYSVEKYFSKLNLKSTDPKLAELINATSNYGYFSQILFDYKTEGLAERTLDKEVSADELLKYSISSEKLPEDVNVQMSLLLKSETAIHLYFSGNLDKLGSSVLVDGKSQELKSAGKDMKYVEIKNIPATQLDKVFEVKAADDGVIKVSALSYACAVLNSENADEANINAMKALYLYSQAANAYYQKEETTQPETDAKTDTKTEKDSTGKIVIKIKFDGKVKF